jgi:hypothetical protein
VYAMVFSTVVKAVPNRVAKAKAKLDFFYNIAVLQPPSLTVL